MLDEYICVLESKGNGVYEYEPVGEIIRCKKCKYCIEHNEILFCNYKGSIGDWRFRTETDFCSRGERKQNEDFTTIEIEDPDGSVFSGSSDDDWYSDTVWRQTE